MSRFDIMLLVYGLTATFSFLFGAYHLLFFLTAVHGVYFLAEIAELVSKWNKKK